MFLAKWASRVSHTAYQYRDFKVVKVLPEKKEVWLLYQQSLSNQNHIEYAKAKDCKITMRRPHADPVIDKQIHSEEETFIQELPVDPDWNNKPSFLLNFNHLF